MTYKLLAIDIDDTLLNDEGEITPTTIEALKAAMDEGVVVTLATGRMYASADAIAARLGLRVPLITYQGALVRYAGEGDIIYARYVPESVAGEVFEYSRKNGLHLQAYVNDRLYVAEENEAVIGYARISNIPYIVEPNIAGLIRLPQNKLLMIDDPERLDAAAAELRDRLGDQAHITKSKPHFLEVMHPEGTKGSALRFLAGHFGCKISETMAIGDSWNDHDMIETAGLGVAMGNGVDALKKIADAVTDSNNEDGVRKAIERFILRA